MLCFGIIPSSTRVNSWLYTQELSPYSGSAWGTVWEAGQPHVKQLSSSLQWMIFVFILGNIQGILPGPCLQVCPRCWRTMCQHQSWAVVSYSSGPPTLTDDVFDRVTELSCHPSTSMPRDLPWWCNCLLTINNKLVIVIFILFGCQGMSPMPFFFF